MCEWVWQVVGVACPVCCLFQTVLIACIKERDIFAVELVGE